MAGPFGGVLHTAGGLADRLMQRLEAWHVARVLTPKAAGAVHLHAGALPRVAQTLARRCVEAEPARLQRRQPMVPAHRL